jgi:nitroreductase
LPKNKPASRSTPGSGDSYAPVTSKKVAVMCDSPEEFLEGILRRRSIRKFTGELLTRDQIEMLLRAAMAAPSANDYQPWNFVVVTAPAMIVRVAKAHPYAGYADKAGAIFVPFGDPQTYRYLQQDLAAATQNLLLMAANMDLGATWCGMNEERQEPVKSILGIPEHLWAFALVPVGVPAEHKPPRTQFDPAKIHWDQFA